MNLRKRIRNIETILTSMDDDLTGITRELTGERRSMLDVLRPGTLRAFISQSFSAVNSGIASISGDVQELLKTAYQHDKDTKSQADTLHKAIASMERQFNHEHGAFQAGVRTMKVATDTIGGTNNIVQKTRLELTKALGVHADGDGNIDPIADKLDRIWQFISDGLKGDGPALQAHQKLDGVLRKIDALDAETRDFREQHQADIVEMSGVAERRHDQIMPALNSLVDRIERLEAAEKFTRDVLNQQMIAANNRIHNVARVLVESSKQTDSRYVTISRNTLGSWRETLVEINHARAQALALQLDEILATNPENAVRVDLSAEAPDGYEGP